MVTKSLESHESVANQCFIKKKEKEKKKDGPGFEQQPPLNNNIRIILPTYILTVISPIKIVTQFPRKHQRTIFSGPPGQRTDQSPSSLFWVPHALNLKILPFLRKLYEIFEDARYNVTTNLSYCPKKKLFYLIICKKLIYLTFEKK